MFENEIISFEWFGCNCGMMFCMILKKNSKITSRKFAEGEKLKREFKSRYKPPVPPSNKREPACKVRKRGSLLRWGIFSKNDLSKRNSLPSTVSERIGMLLNRSQQVKTGPNMSKKFAHLRSHYDRSIFQYFRYQLINCSIDRSINRSISKCTYVWSSEKGFRERFCGMLQGFCGRFLQKFSPEGSAKGFRKVPRSFSLEGSKDKSWAKKSQRWLQSCNDCYGARSRALQVPVTAV